MEINVTKLEQTEHSTISKMFIEGEFVCFIVEDGEHENKIHGMTRIPPGRYDLVRREYGGFYEKYKSRFGHKYVWEVAGVPGFTDILIHLGNTVKDTRGCLLPNKVLELENNLWRGWSSKEAYLKMYDILDAGLIHDIDIIR